MEVLGSSFRAGFRHLMVSANPSAEALLSRQVVHTLVHHALEANRKAVWISDVEASAAYGDCSKRHRLPHYPMPLHPLHPFVFENLLVPCVHVVGQTTVFVSHQCVYAKVTLCGTHSAIS